MVALLQAREQPAGSEGGFSSECSLNCSRSFYYPLILQSNDASLSDPFSEARTSKAYTPPDPLNSQAERPRNCGTPLLTTRLESPEAVHAVQLEQGEPCQSHRCERGQDKEHSCFWRNETPPLDLHGWARMSAHSQTRKAKCHTNDQNTTCH